MSNIIERLTENIVARDLSKEGAALVSKWEKTGLLEGLGNDRMKDNMSRLLENQAKELLREASTMAAGDVEGFAAVAFPIVRRVFGGLLANDLVSVQPMSLPSGLIFFLDFTKGNDGTNNRLGDDRDDSVYGGGVSGSQITGGVNLTGRNAEKSLYSLNNGYSSPVSGADPGNWATLVVTSGAIDANGEFQRMNVDAGSVITVQEARRILRYDPDIASGTGVIIARLPRNTYLQNLNDDDLVGITWAASAAQELDGAAARFGLTQVRRLTQYGTGSDGAADRNNIYTVLTITGTTDINQTATVANNALAQAMGALNTTVNFLSFPAADVFGAGNGLGSVKGGAEWLLESKVTAFDGPFGDDQGAKIPEIDIRVDSVAVTAQTKKLRAKWSPELGQDLNAYHNLDAEVELTGILSEQVALEIDREILEDLIKRSTAGTLHWSRNPGQFLNRETGAEVGAASAAPDFTGTVSEWYETLIETINDVSARIHRKTLRGGANFVVCGPEVAGILEFTAGFRASVTVDKDGSAGAVNVGSISKKFDVHVDPYFPRNVVLVGRKGSSFLESGYVYAPYVPLQVTPTIFGTEDFAPRKGVMTRYGKKMVRPDMYGLVIVHGLVGSSGASS
jgi:hypothetical protein